MKGKSLRINVLLNTIRTILSILFPLVTYPYAARILEPSGIGKIEYVTSVIGIFQVIASLGINSYAISEGSKVRDNEKQISNFVSEIIIINLISTFVTYVLLISCTILGLFKGYDVLIFIIGSSILFNTVGVAWIFNIFEEFKYITVRSILFQLLALIFMLTFVKSKEDLYIYAFLTVFSSVGSNILNITQIGKLVKPFKFRFSKFDVLKHVKPILILFASSAAATLYMNSDKVLLGILVGDESVGLYGPAVKVVSVITTIIIGLRDVILPRMAFFIGKKDYDSSKKLIVKAISYIYMIIFPACLGIIILSRDVITVLFSNAYSVGAECLSILAVELIFSPVNGFMAYQVLVPYRKETLVSGATIIGGLLNVILNFIFIPLWAQNGAAFTTVIAEFSVFIILATGVKKFFKFDELKSQITQFLTASLTMALVCGIITHFYSGLLNIGLCVFFGALVYCGTLFILKNATLFSLFSKLKK